jgi:hypothetical protein
MKTLETFRDTAIRSVVEEVKEKLSTTSCVLGSGQKHPLVMLQSSRWQIATSYMAVQESEVL